MPALSIPCSSKTSAALVAFALATSPNCKWGLQLPLVAPLPLAGLP